MTSSSSAPRARFACRSSGCSSPRTPPNQYGMAPCSPHPPNPRAQSVPSVVKMSRTGSPGLNTLFRTSSPGVQRALPMFHAVMAC